MTESQDITFKAGGPREEGEEGLGAAGMSRMVPPQSQPRSSRAVRGKPAPPEELQEGQARARAPASALHPEAGAEVFQQRPVFSSPSHSGHFFLASPSSPGLGHSGVSSEHFWHPL